MNIQKDVVSVINPMTLLWINAPANVVNELGLMITIGGAEVMGMGEDEEVKEWVNEYGGVTSYSFMIYGPMTVRDNAIINKGLTLQMISEGLGELRYIQLSEEVDSEKAELYGLYRGWNIQWVFPGDENHEIINNTIIEGLEFLKLMHDYLGVMGGEGGKTYV